MSTEYTNPKWDKEENPYSKQRETDTERIIHRHLKDKDDVITDEDIRSIRIGESAEPTTTGSEAAARFNEESDDISAEEEDITDSEPITPIDVLE